MLLKVNGVCTPPFCSSPLTSPAEHLLLATKTPLQPFDMVHVDLANKPRWYSRVHPRGLVPAITIGGRTLVESLDICRCGRPARPISRGRGGEGLFADFADFADCSQGCCHYLLLQGARPARAQPAPDTRSASSTPAHGDAARADLRHSVSRCVPCSFIGCSIRSTCCGSPPPAADPCCLLMWVPPLVCACRPGPRSRQHSQALGCGQQAQQGAAPTL